MTQTSVKRSCENNIVVPTKLQHASSILHTVNYVTRLIQTLVWSVAMYVCESCTNKSADSKRLNTFEMDMYKRMMRISWTEHRTNKSILGELKPDRSQKKKATILWPRSTS